MRGRDRSAILGRGHCGDYRSVERRRALEVKQIFECIGVLIASSQMRAPIVVSIAVRFVFIQAQESLLDQRQQRSVIANGVRHVVRLRERRNVDEMLAIALENDRFVST